MKYCRNSFFHHILVNQREGILRGGLFCQQFIRSSGSKFSEKVSVSSCSTKKAGFLTGFRSLENMERCKIVMQRSEGYLLWSDGEC